MEKEFNEVEFDLEELQVDRMHVFVKNQYPNLSDRQRKEAKMEIEKQLYRIGKKYV